MLRVHRSRAAATLVNGEGESSRDHLAACTSMLLSISSTRREKSLVRRLSLSESLSNLEDYQNSESQDWLFGTREASPGTATTSSSLMRIKEVNAKELPTRQQ